MDDSYINKRNNQEDQKLIFVIGTGRSGTHWIGYLLKKHPNIHVTVEKPEIFQKVTNMALNPTLKNEIFPQLVTLYKEELKNTFPMHYADKSHPNLWHAVELSNEFPQARFIAIYRNPYATIASMLKHNGVRVWYNKWREFPIPNNFLGITKENVKEFEKMSLPAKCALRWQAHYNQLNELTTILKERIHVISYEKLIMQHKFETNRLKDFLNLTDDFPPIDIKKESIDRWKTELSLKVYNEIKEVLGFEGDKFNIRNDNVD
ncbi:sulfotransferase family protein [Cytobacillus sp. Hm23]